MKYLRKFGNLADYQTYVGGGVDVPNVSYVKENNVVYYKSNKVTVQELIDKGYATSTYVSAQDTDPQMYLIQISSACPYSLKSIKDFKEILSNSKQLNNNGIANIFVWRESLPENWTVEGIADIYNNCEIQNLYCPITNMFGTTNFSSVSSLTLNYNSTKTWFAFSGPMWGTNQNQKLQTSPLEFIYKTSACPSSFNRTFASMGSTKKLILANKYSYAHSLNGTFMQSGFEEIVNGIDNIHNKLSKEDAKSLDSHRNCSFFYKYTIKK